MAANIYGPALVDKSVGAPAGTLLKCHVHCPPPTSTDLVGYYSPEDITKYCEAWGFAILVPYSPEEWN